MKKLGNVRRKKMFFFPPPKRNQISREFLALWRAEANEKYTADIIIYSKTNSITFNSASVYFGFVFRENA